ncbi:hypothetical protein CVD23_11225 [Bacillus sp. V33-4]|nr:hypothetical protein CVD23_11225 [Bacillus sp. V33-4]
MVFIKKQKGLVHDKAFSHIHIASHNRTSFEKIFFIFRINYIRNFPNVFLKSSGLYESDLQQIL